MSRTIAFILFFLICPFFLLIGQSQKLFASGTEESRKVVTVWDFKYTDVWATQVFTRVDNLFRDDYPEIQLEHKGYYDQEYIPALRAALLAGTGPDVIWLHHGTEFIEYNPYLERLNDYLNSSELSFRPSSLECCRIGGKDIKALPLTFQGIGWYYNKDLFQRAGLNPENPPDNWNDFFFACQKLKEAGLTPIAAGNNRPITTEFIRRSLISAFYTEEEMADFYKQGRGVVSPRFRLIIEFCWELMDRGYFDKEGLLRPYFSYAPDSFARGESAIIIGLLSDTAHWKYFSDELGSDNIGYFPNLCHPLMARPGIQLIQPAGVLVSINKESDVKEEAGLYIKNLFSEESQEILAGSLGMLTPLEEMPLPVEAYPVLESIKDSWDFSGSDPEKYVPSVTISDLQYRMDDLLINTGEISVDLYISAMSMELKLY